MAKSNLLRLSRDLVVVGGIVFAGCAHAIQPLSEKDMGDVSFESGIEILNVYGSPSAGLEDDVEFKSTKPETNSDQEIETAKSSTKEIIEDIEQGIDQAIDSEIIEENLTFEQIEAAIAEGGSTVGLASFNETDGRSEIRFRDQDFLRGLEVFENGGVQQTRDLFIERLSFENLRGDQQRPDRDIGDVYLSDWVSRGTTQITPD